jgi:hypothetical protein
VNDGHADSFVCSVPLDWSIARSISPPGATVVRTSYVLKYIDSSLWKFQGAPRFLGLGVPAATHGTLERNARRHGWLTVGVVFKINQIPLQGIKELRPPVSGRLAGKVRMDQADGGGTFAHRCCHPFD